MKRIIDLILVFVFFSILVLPMILIFVLIRLTSKGPAIYWSDRVGKNNSVFKMPKFRSMLIQTPTVATHLLNEPVSYLSPIGGFLRRSSLDELPQLFNVLSGSMSLVGPRPNLLNHLELIREREMLGVYKVRPGITGLAQIKKIDMSNPKFLAKTDFEMIENFKIFTYFKLILSTFYKLK